MKFVELTKLIELIELVKLGGQAVFAITPTTMHPHKTNTNSLRKLTASIHYIWSVLPSHNGANCL